MSPQPLRHENLRRTRLVAFVLVPALGALAASCSQGDAGAADDVPAVQITIPMSPLPAQTPESPRAVAPPTTVAPTSTQTPVVTTIAPTTDAPTTTLAPTTTEAPTTTSAPTTTTTTLLPIPPIPPIPSNVEPVEPFTVQLQAVGTRSGEATVWIQLRLIQLGFWNSGTDGQYGLTTKQAVMAFQKYIGLPASGAVDEVTAAYLTNMTQRAHGLTDTGDVIEIDKQKQLLFIVKGGKTLWVLNTSTGNGLPYEEEDKNTPGEIQRGVSITSDGLWKVYRERPEGWWEGDLGEIYRPKYFHGGQAVHGSNSIPNYPASHGCVRVSVPAMDWIWENDLLPMGTTVWVHYGV
jgi:lipoprotein-anchoring transpeptidase ErfK/SrfK